VFEPVRRSIVYNEAKWAAVDLLNAALWITLVALFVWLSVQGAGPSDTIPLGSLFMVYEYAIQAGGVITGIAANFQSLARQQTDFGSSAPFWALPLRPAADRPGAPPEGGSAEWREIHLSGLGYAHSPAQSDDPAERPSAIRDVSIRLRRSRSYALIGPSGSGKTTLLRLLAGLYVPQSGRLVVDAGPAPIETARIPDWLQSVTTLLPQDADLFLGSVRENLLLAIGEDARDAPLSAEPMAAALSVAQAGEFLAGMPKGLDSAVAARGGNFSGGQRQRIAIARALLAAAPSSILLLDEPTSALDPATEAALITALLAVRRDACIVASIHRPQLLASFDEVLVVNAGRVVDQGTVEEVAPRSAELQAFLRRDPRPVTGGTAGA
jgi:ATP-binding cassette, subfamily B, bacterial